MLLRPLKWSIPDAHPTGRAWTDAEREVASQLADGCTYVFMSGIPNLQAATEYGRRALALAQLGAWPYLDLRFRDVRTFIGLRTGQQKQAAPRFHSHLGRLAASRTESCIHTFTGSPQTETLASVVKAIHSMADSRPRIDNPMLRQPNLFDGESQ